LCNKEQIEHIATLIKRKKMKNAQKMRTKTLQPEAPFFALPDKAERLSEEGTRAFSRLIDC
jgi:hypothetical protein